MQKINYLLDLCSSKIINVINSKYHFYLQRMRTGRNINDWLEPITTEIPSIRLVLIANISSTDLGAYLCPSLFYQLWRVSCRSRLFCCLLLLTQFSELISFKLCFNFIKNISAWTWLRAGYYRCYCLWYRRKFLEILITGRHLNKGKQWTSSIKWKTAERINRRSQEITGLTLFE